MEGRERHAVGGSGVARRGRGRRRRLAAIAVAASAWALLAAGAAQAATITVGSALPPESTPKPFEHVGTLINTALPEKGVNVTSPVDGTIVRWRIAGAVGGPFYLRVLRPNGAGAYTGVGTSAAATPIGTGVQTFSTNLPVEAGDTIGVDPSHETDEIGFVTVPGATIAQISPPPIEGATVPTNGGKSGEEIELSAEIQPVPGITGIAPSFGSVAGGTTVKITGTNLGGASAVQFGEQPAVSYTVESDTQISAVAPRSTTAGAVDVNVTTVGGTSPSVGADRFRYTACVVPKLKGKKLSLAKNLLRRSGCKLGKVTGPKKAKAALVVKQHPKPGRVLAPGAKVSVKVQLKKKTKKAHH